MTLTRTPAFAASSVLVACLFLLTSMRAPAGGVSGEQLEILQHMSLVKLPEGTGRLQLTLRISDLNVQIVNGLGETESMNGRGNLILGYDERTPEEVQTGSHNLVIGTRNQHSSYSGIVAGSSNSILAPYATVTGGKLNRIAGPHGAICGGFSNRVTGFFAAVLGGASSTAEGNLSTIYGGSQCWTAADLSVAAGCGQTTSSACEVLP